MIERPLYMSQLLSLKEYISKRGADNLLQKFRDYLEMGSFSQDKKYCIGIYNTIVKNVAESLKIRDIGRLERVLKFMADNIGKETSANNISNCRTRFGAVNIGTRGCLA